MLCNQHNKIFPKDTPEIIEKLKEEKVVALLYEGNRYDLPHLTVARVLEVIDVGGRAWNLLREYSEGKAEMSNIRSEIDAYVASIAAKDAIDKMLSSI